MAYRKGKVWVVNVPVRRGLKVRKHVGTLDKGLAQRVEVMCEELATLREWKLLESITGELREDGTRGTPSVDLLELYDAWTHRHLGTLDQLRQRLDDVDLERYVGEWLKAVAGELPKHSDTPARYGLHVRTLMPEGKAFSRSGLTYRRIVQWLGSLEVSDPTRRKYRAALSSFCTYLVKAEVLPSNPVVSVKAPRAGAARQRYLEMHDTMKLVEAQDDPFRTLSALMHGTGMEISAALKVKRADVDPLTRKVRAHGTKTHARDRDVYVDGWAWEYVEKAIRRLTPSAPLFPGLTRWSASDAHRDACKALGSDFADYRMHDARHSYAVRAIRAGAPLEHVARQLGHADTQMVVKVYGRYKPNESERHEWERIAALQDAERARTAGTGGA
jgi:integrase